MTLTTNHNHATPAHVASGVVSDVSPSRHTSNGECFWMATEFRAALCATGLTDFDAVMNCELGTLFRRRNDRENRRLELRTPSGGTVPVFLKKHFIRSVGTRIAAAFRWPFAATEGRLEAEYIRQLPSEHIPTMALVAYGERLRPGGHLESFVLTRELTGYTQLDDYLQQRRIERPMTNGERKSLIEDVAAIARRFHRQGYNHRDFYTCHFFVRETAAGQWDLRLIDLQRVQRRTRFRRRWILKDLAQLAYSAPDHTIGCRERVRFVKEYLGAKKLRSADKHFIRGILRREWWMRWRLGNYR